jgi:hypothetical protein
MMMTQIVDGRSQMKYAVQRFELFEWESQGLLFARLAWEWTCGRRCSKTVELSVFQTWPSVAHTGSSTKKRRAITDARWMYCMYVGFRAAVCLLLCSLLSSSKKVPAGGELAKGACPELLDPGTCWGEQPALRISGAVRVTH